MQDHDIANIETPLSQIEGAPEVPAWVRQDISPYDIAAICQGGCASGAYMPAVTYHIARDTMYEHGDDVLDYISDSLDELPKPADQESWSGIAVFYLSYAVELWAGAAYSWLEEYEPDEDE
jgi:hypothetical protein